MVRIKSVLGLLTVAIAVIGYLPLAPYLDPLAVWFFPAALCAGLYLRWRERPLPAAVLTALSIVVFLYLGSGFTMERLIPITADLLTVFLGVRMLGEQSGRNCLQVFALALFCLAASSLYNLSALFLCYLLTLLLFLAVSLVVLAFYAHDPEIVLSRGDLKRVLAVSCLMPVASLPLLLLFFVLMPRTQFPLWDFLNRAAPRGTGFSDSVKPGSSASVAEVKSVVLRAICRRVPQERLYWRGIVLNGFSGNAWVRLPPPPEREVGTGSGAGILQEIYPEPSGTPYLLALNVPRNFSGVRLGAAPDTVFTAQRPLDRRVKYQVLSTLSEAIRVEGGIDRDFYLRLPPTVSERVRAKGRDVARPGFPLPERLRLLEAFFRGQRLSYAVTGLPTGVDPIDSFLFEARRGNCEFFASSLATLLRLAGIPARLVGGYRGAQDLAHVWVEAYLDGRGWITIDPSAWSTGFARRDDGSRAWRLYLDALGFYWNKAVVSYDLEKQLALVRTAGDKARNLRFPTFSLRWLGYAAGLLAPLAALLVCYRRRPRRKEERLLRRFLLVVARRYPAAAAGRQGLFELAGRIDDPALCEFVAIYGQALYRDRSLQPEELARLKALLVALGQHRP